jgi:hypothetical protein
MNVGARFAREHALAEEPRSSRRFRWWHLEPDVLASGKAQTDVDAVRRCEGPPGPRPQGPGGPDSIG